MFVETRRDADRSPGFGRPDPARAFVALPALSLPVVIDRRRRRRRPPRRSLDGRRVLTCWPASFYLHSTGNAVSYAVDTASLSGSILLIIAATASGLALTQSDSHAARCRDYRGRRTACFKWRSRLRLVSWDSGARGHPRRPVSDRSFPFARARRARGALRDGVGSSSRLGRGRFAPPWVGFSAAARSARFRPMRVPRGAYMAALFCADLIAAVRGCRSDSCEPPRAVRVRSSPLRRVRHIRVRPVSASARPPRTHHTPPTYHPMSRQRPPLSGNCALSSPLSSPLGLPPPTSVRATRCRCTTFRVPTVTASSGWFPMRAQSPLPVRPQSGCERTRRHGVIACDNGWGLGWNARRTGAARHAVALGAR